MDGKLSRPEQARVNGAKSKGPVTAAGKARSARMPTRHGLCGAGDICLKDEDPRDFHAIHEGLLNTMAPDCVEGAQLVFRMALALQQQARAARLQQRSFGVDENGVLTNLRQLELAHRYMTAADRAYHRCREALIRLHRQPHQGVLLTGAHAERIPRDFGPDEENLPSEPENPAEINELGFGEPENPTPEPEPCDESRPEDVATAESPANLPNEPENPAEINDLPASEPEPPALPPWLRRASDYTIPPPAADRLDPPWPQRLADHEAAAFAELLAAEEAMQAQRLTRRLTEKWHQRKER